MKSKYNENFVVDKVDTWTPYLGSKPEVNVLVHPKENEKIKMLISTQVENDTNLDKGKMHFNEGVQAGKNFAWFNDSMAISYKELKFSYELEQMIQQSIETEFKNSMYSVLVRYKGDKYKDELNLNNFSLKEFIDLDKDYINKNLEISIEIINFTNDFNINEKDEATKAYKIHNYLREDIKNLECSLDTTVHWYQSNYRKQFDEYYKRGLKYRLVYCISGGDTTVTDKINQLSTS